MPRTLLLKFEKDLLTGTKLIDQTRNSIFTFKVTTTHSQRMPFFELNLYRVHTSWECQNYMAFPGLFQGQKNNFKGN